MEQSKAGGKTCRAGEQKRRSVTQAKKRALKLLEDKQRLKDFKLALPEKIKIASGKAEIRPRTRKLTQLLEQVRKLQEEPDVRCIIFVERVIMTHPIAKLIDEDLGGEYAVAVSGAKGMNNTIRDHHLAEFKNGTKRYLVATASMEEGIDVGDCNVVIRFDVFHNVKSHIQGAGRARKEGSRIFYFENDYEEEERNAEKMKQAARLHSEQTRRPPLEKDAYPYSDGSTGAQMDVFTAFRTLQEYIHKTTEKDANQIQIFYRDQEEDSLKLRIPTHKGWMYFDKERAEDIWMSLCANELRATSKATDVFARCVPKERRKKLKKKDEMMRMLAFAGIVQLHRDGIIDGTFEPSEEALVGTACECGPFTSEPQTIQILPRFTDDTVPNQPAGGNPKGELNELTMRLLERPVTKEDIVYTCKQLAQLFI